MMDQPERPPERPRIADAVDLDLDATACARSAACSASSATRTPPRSRRSACTRCSTADRKPPASSRSTASASIPSGAWASSATLSRAREVIDRLPGNAAIGHVRYSTTGETILRNVQPLFCELDGGGFAAAPQRQPHQRPDAAPPAGARRRDHAVDQRHRGDPASRRAVAAQPLHRPLHRRAAPARRRLRVRRR